MKRLDAISDIFTNLRRDSVLCLHTGCAEPIILAKALADHSVILDGVKILTLMPMGETPYAEEGPARHLNVYSFFPGKGLRKAFAAGRVTPIRSSLSQIPAYFERGELVVDMLFLQVSVPDASGYVSLGLAVDYMKSALQQNPIVVAEVNQKMPRTMGDTLVHVSDIDWYIDVDYVPRELQQSEPDKTDLIIANNVAGLIDDGAVLQVGIGSLPDQVLRCLSHHKHLGVHSGIITDAICPLIETGAIDNSRKNFLPGVSVATMAAGTYDFYRFLHGNQHVEFHPSNVTHNSKILAGIDRLTAVNSALQVDLSGAVNAEEVGGRLVSMPGGLIDFAHGATCSTGGKSIVAFRSSFNEGSVSNIVANFSENMPRTLQHEDVDYFVTEYGVAHVRGVGERERSRRLIDIAYPGFRDQLSRQLYDAPAAKTI